MIDQKYLRLTGKPLFDESYVSSPVKVAQKRLGKLESLLTESANVTEKDLASTAKFLRMCLSVKIANRATALEVLEGGWITSGCACGWRRARLTCPIAGFVCRIFVVLDLKMHNFRVVAE